MFLRSCSGRILPAIPVKHKHSPPLSIQKVGAHNPMPMAVFKNTLNFEDLTCDIISTASSSCNVEYKRLLHGLSGQFESGKLYALMGASGNGKTAFLSILSGHLSPATKTHGRILYNGNERDPEMWEKQCSFVRTKSDIPTTETLQEYVELMTMCRSSFQSYKEVRSFIRDVFDELGLLRIAHVAVAALSDGERKLVKIAIELVVGTNVLILDEPLGNVDLHRALEMTLLLKHIARKYNRIIILTIQQPGSKLFEEIDYLFFMYKGIFLYQGPVDRLEEFFRESNFFFPDTVSKPEFLLEIFAENGSQLKELVPHRDIYRDYVQDKLDRECARAEQFHTSLGAHKQSVVPFSFRHTKLLFYRAFRVSFRGNYRYFFMFHLAFVFFATCVAASLRCREVLAFLHSHNRIRSSAFSSIPSIHDTLQLHYPAICHIVQNIIIIQLSSVNLYLSNVLSAPMYYDMSHLIEEANHRDYSIYSYYIALVGVEISLDMLKTLLFITIIHLFNLQEGFSGIFLFFYFFFSSSLSKLSLLMTLPIGDIPGLPIIMPAIRLLFMMYSSGNTIVNCVKTPENTSPLTSFTLFLFGLVFWNNYFLELYLDGVIGRRIEQVVEKTPDSGDSNKLLRCTLKTPEGVPFPKYRASIWFFGWMYPSWVNFLFVVLGIFITMLISMWIFRKRYAPPLRLSLG